MSISDCKICIIESFTEGEEVKSIDPGQTAPVLHYLTMRLLNMSADDKKQTIFCCSGRFDR